MLVYLFILYHLISHVVNNKFTILIEIMVSLIFNCVPFLRNEDNTLKMDYSINQFKQFMFMPYFMSQYHLKLYHKKLLFTMPNLC